MSTITILRAAALAAVLTTLPARGQGEDPAAKLERLTSGVAPGDTARQNDLERKVEQLSKTGQVNVLKAIGEGTGPTLVRLAEELSLDQLLDESVYNPVHQLFHCAPDHAVDFYTSMARTRPELYAQLQRSGRNIGELLRKEFTNRLSDDGKARLATLAVRTMELDALPLLDRIRLAELLLFASGLEASGTLEFLGSVAPTSERARAVLLGGLGDSNIAVAGDRVMAFARSLLEQPDLSETEAGMLKSALGARWATGDAPGPAEVRALFEAALTSPHEAVRKLWSNQSTPLGGPAEALAVLDVAVEHGFTDRTRLMRSIEQGILKADATSPERAGAVLTFLGKVQDARWCKEFGHDDDDEVLALNKNKVHLSRLFAALEPERIPEALDWLAGVEIDARDRYRLLRNPMAWKDSKEVMKTVFGGGDVRIEVQLIAANALLAGRPDLAKNVAVLVAGKNSRLPVLREALPEAQQISRETAAAWTTVSLQLMSDPKVPDALANVLTLPNPGTTEFETNGVAHRLLMAATDRLARASIPMDFRNLRYFGMRAMVENPALLSRDLLDLWLTKANGSAWSYRIFVQLANQVADPDLSKRVADALGKMIAASDNSFEKKTGAEILVKLHGTDAIPRLIALALASDDREFTTHVEEMVTRTMNLRRAAAEWRALASGGDTRAEATAKVVALLDSPNREVRIEAIHGLGTLGAVETLPRLIELVASEDAEVKAAALSSLKRLRDRPLPPKAD